MTLIPTFSGIFAGYIMAAIPPLNQWDIPDTVARIFTNRFLQSFIDDPPTPTIVATGRHNPFAGIGDAPPPPRRQRAAAPPPPQPETQFQQLPPPPESSIEQLTSMGFQRDAVIQALRTSHNDVERAADRLLSGG
eukprot:CAMPEP_0202455108 /NCGR_PEP_ID=MMETSP1360-20130828/12714_1 /ASSEMBLY_ACC=CAM_ASM_000848 /TAXON_ID=515479 /ORGANISM="Licmophora paradoxa, Strain CCMP2313" /LENGTH=134 /DNA_ID=CAMNT_0049074605 /DNA_START=97 /DNA_END=501 /DNA_ORIENTATION=-